MLDAKWKQALGLAGVFANVDDVFWSYLLVDDGRSVLAIRVFCAGRTVGMGYWNGTEAMADGPQDGVDFPDSCAEQLWWALDDSVRSALKERGLI